MNLTSALNTAWMLKCRGQLHAFHRATCNVAQTQSAVLADIVKRNRATDFGRKHGFDSTRTPNDFQARVSLSTYDSYAESIHRIASGEANVLTHEPVRLFEPTSGTTRGEKLIPYTASLAGQFHCAIAAWIADLMQHRPAVRRGRAYWSISPAFGQARRTSGGIAIGFDDDTAYLGRLERLAARRLLVAPPEIARLTDLENFRYATLLHLILAGDLALISIWSPTFLSALFGSFEQWGERICHDLRNGTLSLPNMQSGDAARPLQPRVSVRRADDVRSILRSDEPLSDRLRRIWPRLALISCWTDAAAAGYVDQIRSLFPSVEIQPKGLLATEGCVSFPLVGRVGAALALRSHFFEFANVDTQSHDQTTRDDYVLAHELASGSRYKVVITTAGGLYRYQLHDVVEVVGLENDCPLLRFVGKADRVSDLVGEKLSEPHVRAVLTSVFSDYRIDPDFSMVVPVSEHPPRYRLYLQCRNKDSRQIPDSSLAIAVQAGLEENPYYRHAVRLCQLSPLDVCVFDGSGKPAWLIYEQGCLTRGQKAGDIKPTALDCRANWPDDFSLLARAATSANTTLPGPLASRIVSTE